MPSLRLLLTFLLLLLAALSASAHPGIGIVRDHLGNVFYTDLVHVWRISPDGKKSVAVRNVHTHELAVDGLGNVYGEDNRYLGSGEGDEHYRHRIWRRSPDGRITDVVPWRAGFWRDYGFVRDRAGAMYWIRCPARRCSILRRAQTPVARALTTIAAAPGSFTHPINWFAASATEPGVLYVVDGPALRRVDPSGRVTTVAPNVGTHLMGLWPTLDGRDVYVAAYGLRAIVRVRLADGAVTTVIRSPIPWAPSGVLVAPDGHLWVLEYSTANAARVRRVPPRDNLRP